MDQASSRCHSNLVAASIITHHGARCVRAMTLSSIRYGRIRADGIPPVVVVVNIRTIRRIKTAAVLANYSRMIPILTRIIPSYHRSLTGVP
jgi:hypothetical protein